MVPRARATRALVLAAFASAWTFACVMTFSRFPATPSERSGRFPTREDDARARAVFDAHAGHVAFAASARGAFESRSRGVDVHRVPYGTARVVDGASNAERFDVHAGHAGFRASSEASSRWRSADYDTPPAVRRPSEDAVGMESAPELDVGARSPPATDHLDQLDQLDPHEVAIILVDDPTRPDETPLREERRDEHPRGRHLRERDDAAMDEGAGRRASPTTGTRSKTSSGRRRSALANAVVRTTGSFASSCQPRARVATISRVASSPRSATPPKTPTRSTSACTPPTRICATPCAPRIRERDACERTAKTATMTATMTATIDASSVTNPSSKDSKDSAARREWYARETTDMIAALESAEASGDAADDAAVLFLEDDVIPATSWETKLRTSVGRHATRDDATSTWWCDFDVFSLYAAGWDSGEDGHVGAFESGTQALFFCAGGARQTAKRLRERFGEAPPDWLIRDATRDAKVRFAVPSLFQHGCERSTLAEKEFRHTSKTFRSPATKCLKKSDDERGNDGEGDEGTVHIVVPR